MTRDKIKMLIHQHRIADGSRYDETLNALEKAIDDLIEAERIDEIVDERRQLSARFLAILIEKHDGGEPSFDRAIAGRAVAYADELIKTLRERKAP